MSHLRQQVRTLTDGPLILKLETPSMVTVREAMNMVAVREAVSMIEKAEANTNKKTKKG
jgi:hypothetical protein